MTATAEFDPPDVPPSRRERRKRETRAALEAAALRLFAEKGYEQTTVEEIAEAAEVAVRTFFRYFSSKQHVLYGDIAHDRVARLRAALDTRPPDEAPMDSIRAVLDLLELSTPEEHEQALVRMRLLERQPSLRGAYLAISDDLRQVIADFVAARTGLSARDDRYPLLVAAAAASSWSVALALWSASDGRRPLHDLRCDAFEVLTAGLSAIAPANGTNPNTDGG